VGLLAPNRRHVLEDAVVVIRSGHGIPGPVLSLIEESSDVR
jgi:hypothetical protein